MRYIRFCSVAAATAAIVTGLAGGPAAAADPDYVPCSGTALALAVNNARNGETLDLRRDCIYHLSMALQPILNRELTIRGNGATIVRDGASTLAFRIFDVASGGDLRLKDLTVRGGVTAGDGAGIRVNGNGGLRLTKVDVLDNTATGNGGGVAVAPGGSADIRSSYVAFNNAANGGGLYTAGSVTIENSEFARNHAQASGGGIHQGGGMTFVGTSVVRRNTAAGSASGGGLYIGNGTMDINQSKITNNTDTGSRGGGIYNGGNLTLTKSEVSGNVVGGTAGQGGGIYNTGTLTLKGTEVFRNSANGSGLSVAGGIYNAGGTVSLDHSTIRDNASTTAPGGLRTNVPIMLRDSTITHNIPTNCFPSVIPGCTD